LEGVLLQMLMGLHLGLDLLLLLGLRLGLSLGLGLSHCLMLLLADGGHRSLGTGRQADGALGTKGLRLGDGYRLFVWRRRLTARKMWLPQGIVGGGAAVRVVNGTQIALHVAHVPGYVAAWMGEGVH